jgi:hypothetical protein
MHREGNAFRGNAAALSSNARSKANEYGCERDIGLRSALIWTNGLVLRSSMSADIIAR